jgi:DNA-binding transcriptional LysR family regulator
MMSHATPSVMVTRPGTSAGVVTPSRALGKSNYTPEYHGNTPLMTSIAESGVPSPPEACGDLGERAREHPATGSQESPAATLSRSSSPVIGASFQSHYAHNAQVIDMNPVQEGSASHMAGMPAAIELRHLRYFVAVAEMGSFTRAAERLFIAQPTLSQQIRRLEEIIGAPLLQRRREGLQLTAAGTVLLDAARNVLSMVDRELTRTRQAAGLGRQRLRMVVPPRSPDSLAVETTAALRSASAAADVEVVWMETPMDADFSLVRQGHADAGLGWLTTSPEALPDPLDVMVLGEFEPDVWIPASHPAAGRGTIDLCELVGIEVIHGPRRTEAGTYDAWVRVLRAVDPRFEFTDPPLRHSLRLTLAFAASADKPVAVLTGPSAVAGTWPGLTESPGPEDAFGMVRVRVDGHPLTAVAALVWNGDLPRPLQQVLFEAAEDVAETAGLVAAMGAGESRLSTEED